MPASSRAKLPHCAPNEGNALSEWYSSPMAEAFFVSHPNFKNLSSDDISKRCEKKALQAKQRKVKLDLATSCDDFLHSAFQKKLQEVCRQEHLNFDHATSYFIAPKGNVCPHINMYREFSHRADVNRRIISGTICGGDEAKWRDWLDEHGEDIPIEDFVCTSRINWRPRRCGAVQIASGKQHPCLGRYSLTDDERRTGMTAPNAQQDAYGMPWQPMCAQTMKKLKGVVKPFIDWRKHNEYVLKPARQMLSTIARTKKVAEGKRHDRVQDTDRPPRSPKRDRGGRRLQLTVAPPVQLVQNNCALNRQQTEQIQKMQETWLLLGHCARGGEWKASLDWLYELAHVLEHSSCLVWDTNDLYPKPDGSHFRKMKDWVSHVDDDLNYIFDCTEDDDGEAFHDKNDNKNYLVFHKGKPDLEHFMRPYAARMDVKKNLLQIDFNSLFRYYLDQYNIVKSLLDDWREAFDSLNGGFSIQNVHQIRQHIDDDPVFGSGQGWLLSEPLPRVTGEFPRRRPIVRVRHRVAQGDIGLPQSIYPLIAEMDLGCGWMAWVNNAFYTQGADETWQILPFHNEEFRLLGWKPGDDLSDERHDYATVLHEMPTAPDLLPYMFPFD